MTINRFVDLKVLLTMHDQSNTSKAGSGQRSSLESATRKCESTGSQPGSILTFQLNQRHHLVSLPKGHDLESRSTKRPSVFYSVEEGVWNLVHSVHYHG